MITPDKVPGVEEEDFVCYPLRGDSLSFYSRLYDRKILFGRGLFEIDPDEAAAYLAERLGTTASRESAQRRTLNIRSRLATRIRRMLMPLLPSRGRGLLEPFFYPLFSEVFDWDEPPFFKSFLRLEATTRKLKVTCYGVTGCREDEEFLPIEDSVDISLGGTRSGSEG